MVGLYLYTFVFVFIPYDTLLLSIFPPEYLDQKVETAQNLTSSDPKPSQDSKGQVKREHEGITVRFFF